MDKKIRFGFVDPKTIMTIVVSLMILGIGVFAFFMTTTQLQEDAPVDCTDQTFAVANPAVNQNCNVGTDRTIGTVTQVLSDGSRIAIDAGNYTYNPTTGIVTVNSGPLYG